jgi:hypothetical protein
MVFSTPVKYTFVDSETAKIWDGHLGATSELRDPNCTNDAPSRAFACTTRTEVRPYVSVTPSALQSILDWKKSLKVVIFSYDIYNVYTALIAVIFLAAAQAFGTMSLIW